MARIRHAAAAGFRHDDNDDDDLTSSSAASSLELEMTTRRSDDEEDVALLSPDATLPKPIAEDNMASQLRRRSTTSSRSRSRKRWLSFQIALSVVAVMGLTYLIIHSNIRGNSNPWAILNGPSEVPGIVPDALMDVVYQESDFGFQIESSQYRAPPYWECHNGSCNVTNVWGPCYAPHRSVDWKREVIRRYNVTEHAGLYDTFSNRQDSNRNDLAGYCRPGFIIIGAGKCGTSSLYHYIVSHPRVLPAKQKQIHYFKYYLRNGIKWYLQHFPTTRPFLASGALATGEASPGYLPYPDVPDRVRQALPDARIIAIGRHPLERAYSSYRYSYVRPTVDSMRKGRHAPHIVRNQNDTYYEQFLFSFQELLQAELTVLQRCLAVPSGAAVQGARLAWSIQSWARPEFARRKQLGLPPMVDLDGFCYGAKVNQTVLRRQWADLVQQYPEKVLEDKDLHLTESLLGRSLYVLPLEWWYAVFDRTQLYFVCTEEMRDITGAPLAHLAHDFLGLPTWNFASTIQQGAYNVGGDKGYDKEVSWDKLQNQSSSDNSLPLSPEFRQELERFIEPYNERLFDLIGKRCQW